MDAIRSVLDKLRREIKLGEASPESLDENTVTERIHVELSTSTAPSLKRVVNGTGVVIHTNLGRSLLSETVGKSFSIRHLAIPTWNSTSTAGTGADIPMWSLSFAG
jgi:hypothetical protein